MPRALQQQGEGPRRADELHRGGQRGNEDVPGDPAADHAVHVYARDGGRGGQDDGTVTRRGGDRSTGER